MAFPALPAGAKVVGFFTSRTFLIPAAIVAFLLAIGGGTYLYLQHDKANAVSQAVETADSDATIQSYKAKDDIQQHTVVIDMRMDKLANQTTKDYANARSNVEKAPTESREAPVPDLVIDTLNDLDRLRGNRQQGDVPDAGVPVG